MKKLLVTGGCGFIGSEVVKKLMDKGYEVTVADNLSKPESSVKQGYRFENVDLTDKHSTSQLFKGYDICLHFAAKIGGIGYFHKYPATILSENNKLLSSVFEATRDNNLERIIYVSSSMVFEKAQKFPSKEEDVREIAVPVSHYGLSKLIGEWYCTGFNEEFGVNYSIVRPFNAYGINEMPGEEIGYAHVIPDFIKKVLTGQYPLEIMGCGNQTRCYTHVRDLAEGIITVMESDKAVNQDFNISSRKETSVLELAQRVWKKCGDSRPFNANFIPSFKHDVQRRIPDVTKAKNVLGWEARIDLEDGLDEVINWLRPKF